jgi:predicted alpha/beta superfamily hydrolase
VQAYRDYLVQVVKPLDRPDLSHASRIASNTAVMGSSMGGCVSFLLLWEHPEVFSRAGCLSPSL